VIADLLNIYPKNRVIWYVYYRLDILLDVLVCKDFRKLLGDIFKLTATKIVTTIHTQVPYLLF